MIGLTSRYLLPLMASDSQRTGAPFSKLFEDFIKKALNKVPSQRASAADLLKHKFLKGRTQDALVHQLLDQIPAVSLNHTFPQRLL